MISKSTVSDSSFRCLSQQAMYPACSKLRIRSDICSVISLGYSSIKSNKNWSPERSLFEWARFFLGGKWSVVKLIQCLIAKIAECINAMMRRRSSCEYWAWVSPARYSDRSNAEAWKLLLCTSAYVSLCSHPWRPWKHAITCWIAILKAEIKFTRRRKHRAQADSDETRSVDGLPSTQLILTAELHRIASFDPTVELSLLRVFRRFTTAPSTEILAERNSSKSKKFQATVRSSKTASLDGIEWCDSAESSDLKFTGTTSA